MHPFPARRPAFRYVWLLLLLSGPLYGQSSVIDSLEGRLREPRLPDTLRIDRLNTLAREYTYISATKATGYAQQALDWSTRIDYRRGQAYAFRNLASSYSAQEYFYSTTEFMEKAITLFEELSDSVGLANCYITLGHTYKRQQDLARSVAFHAKAVAIFRQKKLPERLGVSLHNLGESQFLAGDRPAAKRNTHEAIVINQSLGNAPVLTACYKVMGIILLEEKDAEGAKGYFKAALALSETLGKNAQKEATVPSLLYLARIARQQNQAGPELEYLQRAVALAREHHYTRHVRDASMALVNHYLDRNDRQAASLVLREYAVLSDSLIAAVNREKASMLEPMMRTVRTLSENKRLQAEQRLQQEKIASQRTQLVFYLVMTLVLVTALGTVYYLSRERRKMLDSIVAQKKVIEENAVRLQELNATKDKFFSIVAHDLKSPLAVLQGFLLLWEDGTDDFTREEMQYFIRELNKKMNSTLELTENLIRWAGAQMQSHRSVAVPVPLAGLVAKVLGHYESAAGQKEITVRTDIPAGAAMHADPDQLEFMVRNLLNNAIKFTPSRGVVTLAAAPGPEGTVQLTVRDTGVGMPPEKLQTLFALEKTVSTEGTAGEKGTGLGLLLCKEFVEKNGGQLFVESLAGSGTTFPIRLPEPAKVGAAG
ncbi:MAG: hypothetical protein ICV83_05150 [Cytophagales bacterium]|nr:hypothetical protein [Cytophagales bacterium]